LPPNAFRRHFTAGCVHRAGRWFLSGRISFMPDRGFEILLEDDACLAVAKPSGIATQAPPGIESLEARIKAYLAADGQDPSEIYLGIPHRLDRPASGAMIFAKTRRAARQLSKQFERRRVKKLYWAAVERVVEPLEGTWTDYLWKVYGQPRALLVEHTHPQGQQAILHYRTLGFHRAGTWLEIELETGRTHQVRVQTSSRGHPILGDAHYGSRIPFGPQHDDERSRAIALHARRLTFCHPTTREEVSLEAPLDDAWSELDLKPRG
jgi:23S rRNA pseudouridine1911/1915/1917 synthase